MENEEQLDRLDTAIAMSLGVTKAHRLALMLIIAAHPDRERLRTMWQQALPQWLDNEAEKLLHGHLDAREAFHAELAMVSRVLDASAS